MPRPKPPSPLRMHGVRLTDTQWAAFQDLGGGAWLRSRLDKLRATGVARRQRNQRMQAERNAGDSLSTIARRHGVDRATVSRNTRCAQPSSRAPNEKTTPTLRPEGRG